MTEKNIKEDFLGSLEKTKEFFITGKGKDEPVVSYIIYCRNTEDFRIEARHWNGQDLMNLMAKAMGYKEPAEVV